MANTRSFADKLDTLFRTVRRPDGKEHSHGEVARYLTAHTGESHSRTFVTNMRTGKQPNPRLAIIQALAEFFQVDVSYFFEDGDRDDDLEGHAALRRDGVRQVALRATELDETDLKVVNDVIDALIRKQRA